MKKSSLRAFGIACFLIGAIYTSIDTFHLSIPFITTSNNIETDKQYEETISKLETKLAEAKKQITALKEENSVVAIQQEESKTVTSKATNPELISGTLYIYSGLTPAEVATKLKEMGIVKNSVEIELFLAQPEYAKSIQKGQFEVNSSMTVEEIANIITGK